jgi:16S rRNA pseudouridine516 synthase
MSKASTTLRLDRLLANLGYGSRREVQQLIFAGQVLLDGEVAVEEGRRIAIAPNLSQRMLVCGSPLDPPPGMVVMLHKPLGVTCSHKEAGALVYDLLPLRWRRREPTLSTVGRLDKDTSGLLLMTDDGALLHKIISPKRHIAKRYLAKLARPLDPAAEGLFASGTLLLEGEDKPLLPAKLESIDPLTAYLTISEGRYHQVRRMFAAKGNHVVALHRDRIGELALPDDLSSGAFCVLTEAQIEAIFKPGS